METSRRERKKQEKKVAILKAAELLFKEKGLSAVSLEEIADAVDISRGTIYNHFHSKDSLIKSLLEPFMVHHASFMTHFNNQKDRSLENVLRLCIKLWENHKNIFQLLENNDLNRWPEIKEKHVQMVSDFDALFVGLDLSKLKFQDPKQVAAIVLRLFQPLLGSLEGLSNRDELFVDCMKDLLVKH